MANNIYGSPQLETDPGMAATAFQPQTFGPLQMDPGMPGTINGGTDPYALAQQYNMPTTGKAGLPVTYSFEQPNPGWQTTANGSYVGMPLQSNTNTNGLGKVDTGQGQAGYVPNYMGNIADPSLNARFSLASGVTQNNGGNNSLLMDPTGAGIASWSAGANTNGQPSSINAGYSWQNGQIVADPNSNGFVTDASGNLIPMHSSAANAPRTPSGGNLGAGGIAPYQTPAFNQPGPAPSWSGYSGYTPSPYLDSQANDITRRVQQALGETLNGIQTNAVGVGGLGGARQGVEQGIATRGSMDNLAGQLANLYGTDYTNASNRNLQRYSTDLANYQTTNAQGLQKYGIESGANLGARGQDITALNNQNQYQLGVGGLQNQKYGLDLTAQNNQNNYQLGLGSLQNQSTGLQNSYDLGLRGNDLGFAQLDSNINQNNFNNQLAGANFGLNTYQALLNAGNLGLNTSNSMQNTPINYFNQFSNNANSIGNGYGTSTTGSTSNPLLGVLGGANLGYNLYNNYSGGAVSDNGYSSGVGPNYAGSYDANGNFTPYRAGM